MLQSISKSLRFFFFDSPHAALRQRSSQSFPQSQLHEHLESKLLGELWSQLYIQLGSQLKDELYIKLDYPLTWQLSRQLHCRLLDHLVKQFGQSIEFLPKSIAPERWACRGSLYDYYFSVLNCKYEQKKWQLFQSIVKHCGWIYPFERIALVCDRPINLFFDSGQQLHAEGRPAIEFTDGYSLYSYHGVTLPDRYGKVSPNQWCCHWLLEEKNAELRRVLIQGIGYQRIWQELRLQELDTWQGYTLSKIEAHVDVEPIYLLKMTCPSTEFIHVLRVPPDITSAREAIRWVNWGIDPEQFLVQT